MLCVQVLSAPDRKGKKGSWIDLAGQRRIMNDIDRFKYGEEVLFYLMTGAGCEEALYTTINFEKRIAKIRNLKSERDGVEIYKYVELSKEYCNRIKDKWSSIFKYTAHHYSTKVGEFLRELGLQGKSCHSLRHTFSSNLYYLGVDDKRCQMMMGHGSIMMTRDIYTTFDPTISAKDIIKIYGNLCPFVKQDKNKKAA